MRPHLNPQQDAERRRHHHQGRGGRGGRRGIRGEFRGDFRGGFERGPRARRGDVRAAVLALLAEQPRHGYEVIQELADRSGGVWRPSPGSVYPTLQLLQDEGLVTADDVDGRRVFTLTDAGRTAAAERDAEPKPWDAVADEEPRSGRRLQQLGFQVMAATKQVAYAGTEQQQAAAAELLSDTRRGLYRLLAEDEPTGSDD